MPYSVTVKLQGDPVKPHKCYKNYRLPEALDGAADNIQIVSRFVLDKGKGNDSIPVSLKDEALCVLTE